MKTSLKIVNILIVGAFLFTSVVSDAQRKAQPKKSQQRQTKRPTTKAQPKTTAASQIQFAVTQLKNGQNLAAANNLLALSRRKDLVKQRPQIKYLLGLAFMEMNMNQVAAFQFVDVIKTGNANFVKNALVKLLVVTDKLGDETLLNYALQRIDVKSLPSQHRDILYYHLGEINQKSRKFSEAHQMYSQVGPNSRFYLNALYNLGLSQAEANQTTLALETFNKLVKARASANVLDTNKVAAQLALARVHYQRQDWAKSIEAYSMIPRDHFLWHSALFEQSWAMLRAARFRSALSNFQSLHSSYYDDFYIPETLILRAIVYLYICKYNEMEKVLNLFDSQYDQVQKNLTSFLKTRSSIAYYNEVEKAYLDKFAEGQKTPTRIPYLAARHVASEGDVRRSLAYIQKITNEKNQIEGDARIRNIPVGAYALKLLNNRIRSAKERTGDLVKAHLRNMNNELTDLKEQASLVRYEMINGQKEMLKKKIAQKDVEGTELNEDKDRSFYAQNGYEYYPFQGEFWLDEIGNYHYLGKQSCE